MPVNSAHADYTARIDQWTRCRDVLSGQDAVHARGETYLPKLKEQAADDYTAYMKRTTFYNAAWRTVSGLVGMILRKPPRVEVPDTANELLDDVTLNGTPFTLFLQDICREAIGIGRVGVLVDYPVPPIKTDGTALTQADAQSLQLRPTMQMYRAESIINWRCSHIGSAYILSMVVLKEKHPVPKDAYSEVYEDRYRVLDLDESGDYRVRVFKCDMSGAEVQIGTDLYPTMGAAKLRYIPFTFIGPDGVTTDAEEPPLIDLVNMNLSHYRTTADYEHAAHFVGLPTPVVTGYTPEKEGEKLYIGSSAAWILRNENAKAFYLEFTGQGLVPLKDMLAGKEQQMAILGARMLEPRIRGVEAAETASIHRKGEESMLSAMSQAISLGATIFLRWFVEWDGVDSAEVNCELNRDFYPQSMTPQMLTALVAGWQSGAYSDQVLFDNLQAGEIIDSETTLEDEQARKNTAPPKLAPVLGGFPNKQAGAAA